MSISDESFVNITASEFRDLAKSFRDCADYRRTESPDYDVTFVREMAAESRAGELVLAANARGSLPELADVMLWYQKLNEATLPANGARLIQCPANLWNELIGNHSAAVGDGKVLESSTGGWLPDKFPDQFPRVDFMPMRIANAVLRNDVQIQHLESSARACELFAQLVSKQAATDCELKVKWSKATNSKTKWANILKIDRSTFNRGINKNRFQVLQVTDNQFRINVENLPDSVRDKYM